MHEEELHLYELLKAHMTTASCFFIVISRHLPAGSLGGLQATYCQCCVIFSVNLVNSDFHTLAQ